MKKPSIAPLATLLAVILVPLCPACTADEEATMQSQVVVEGWIEDGEFPIVKLTRSIPINTHYQSLDSLENYILRWQRVTISDGTREVTLMGKYDNRYFPPYVYTTTDMRGEAGRSYTLTVHQEHGPDVVARTEVPQPVSIDSFSVEPVSSSDTLCQVYAYVNIPREPVTYYKVFTRTDRDSRDYLSPIFSVVRSDMVGTDGRISISKGRTNMVKDYTPYFAIGDTLAVRFARINAADYDFWRTYEDMLSLSHNPLFPTTDNLPSNVEGGMGFWQGWGSTYYYLVAKEK